jgi:lipopolysaccharide biosynthesis glycosyltransferase
MCLAETILSLGDYTTPNKSFERNYANKYFAKGFQTAFFEGIYSLHIGKQHWEIEGQNAYALNAEIQFNSQIQGNQLTLSNIIVEPEQQKQQKQQWEPVTYPKFQGTMADHLNQLKGLLTQKIPFALIRPSDGEYSVIKGQTLTNCDKWTFQAGGTLQTDLLQAVQTDVSGLYVGIPCNTCNKSWNCTQTIYDDYRALLRTENITYANLFMNANWPAFVQLLKEDTRPLYVVTSGSTGTTELSIRGRHIIDPLLVNKWDEEGVKETVKILEFVRSKNNTLICFSAGPLSKVWIPKCWALNPTNTYLDVGAALDPFTKGPEVKSRFYTDRGHPFAKEACLFQEQQIINPERLPNKCLVYICVFHNRNYLKLLELLLASMKLFSRIDTFDVLVMTSPDFEKEVQQISDLVQIPLKIHLCDFKTFLESASARLYIHEYPEIDSYDKILYIDTDIVIQNDLTALLSESLEEKVYALPEGTIEHEYHGGWYFDFKILDKNLPGLNSGILLFPNTPTIRKLFQECSAHIKQEQQSGKPMPACLDQPFLNYHFVKGNHYDVRLMTKYALIYCEYPPPPPSQPTTIALCHFVWPVGNAPHKLNRMRKHVTHLLNNYSVLYPATFTPETDKIIKASYTWGANGYILFESDTKFNTTWASNNYTWISSDILKADWHGYNHILQFSPSFDSFLSIRKGDCLIGRHTRNIQESIIKESVIPEKCLIYVCVFNNPKYVDLLKLLLTSYSLQSIPLNTDLLIMTSSDLQSSIQEVANSLNLSIHFMIKDAVLTNHEAACMRLKIFDYPLIQAYRTLLYLDTDILIQHSLQPLLEQSIQDQLYALEEGTIDQGYHGSWYFDFQTIDRKTPAINSGVLLFPNTPLMKQMFQETDANIEGRRLKKERLPDAYDQPFINYHFIKAGKCNSTLLKDYVKIYFQNPETKPTIPICHFAGNMGDANDKLPRMMAHMDRFILQPVIIPGKYLVYACVFYNKNYTELLKLLIASTKFYSLLQEITFLVFTSKEFEPAIQELAKSYQFPIITKTFDYTTIFQAACARLSIFDYDGLASYEKILYLDTDIIIKGHLTTLFQLPLEDKLYGLESGFTDSINFGVQFFSPPVKTAGFNSGTLLFPNSPTIKSLFQRIRTHIETYMTNGATPPYALDQPFINYHAIKDGLYENQTLKPYIALYEDNDVPTNEHTAIVCHFSFPIGNFAHKYNRMKTYFNRYLNHFTIEDKLQIVDILKGKRFSWDAGFIEFKENQVLLTTWGKGTYEFITADIVRCVWNNHYHVLRFTGTSYFGVRTWPNDYVMARGHLL